VGRFDDGIDGDAIDTEGVEQAERGVDDSSLRRFSAAGAPSSRRIISDYGHFYTIVILVDRVKIQPVGLLGETQLDGESRCLIRDSDREHVMTVKPDRLASLGTFLVGAFVSVLPGPPGRRAAISPADSVFARYYRAIGSLDQLLAVSTRQMWGTYVEGKLV